MSTSTHSLLFLAIPPTTLGMVCSDSPPLELRFWQRSCTIHPKQIKWAQLPRHFTPAYKHFCYQHFQRCTMKEGNIFLREESDKETKAMVLNREQCGEWRGINTRTHPMASVNVVHSNLISTPNPTDEDKPEHLMSIQRSEAVVITASTLKSWSSHPQDTRLINWSDSCIQNRNDRPRHTCDIMVKTLRTPNDAHNSNYAKIAQQI